MMKIQYEIYKPHNNLLDINAQVRLHQALNLAEYCLVAAGRLSAHSSHDYIKSRRNIFSLNCLEYGDVLRIDNEYYLRNYGRWDVVEVFSSPMQVTHFQRLRLQKEIRTELTKARFELQ